MSDGALSQQEIDALLAGSDGGGAATAVASAGTEADRKAFLAFLSANIGAESSNLSTMTGATVALKDPSVAFTNRDALLEQLPETVTVVKTDFSSGFPGEHIFILPEDTAKKIASLMNKEENIQMDEMAMAVIGEVVSQLVSTQITDLTKRTNNKSIAAMPPEAANIKKAAAALPAGEFLGASFQLDLGDGETHQIWEVYGGSVATDISRALTGGAAQAAPARGGNMSSAGRASTPGMSMPIGSPANVQSVQFPNLSPHNTIPEGGNIGLIMDVSMEMTVELGRTKKLIKDILSMGEGTIIELDKLAGEPVDILVNHKLIAKGEVVVIDENFGVRVTEIVSPQERINDLM